jgi:hypothetical protein
MPGSYADTAFYSGAKKLTESLLQFTSVDSFAPTAEVD